MALREGTEFVNGQVKDTNLDTYTLLRIGEIPELDIQLSTVLRLQSASANRRRPSLPPPLAMRSLLPSASGSGICQSGPAPCSRLSNRGIEPLNITKLLPIASSRSFGSV